MSTSTPHSPLEPIFAGHDSIPVPFVEQFLYGEHLPFGMKLVGVMHRIWHRPWFLSPLFWMLGKVGILVPHNAENVPTSLVVRPGRNELDGLFHVWDRTLTFGRPVRFRTTIIYDASIGKVVDLVGPKNLLYMVWEAKFHPPSRFTLDTDSIAFRFGRRKLWLPRPIWKFLFGTVTFTQTADPVQQDKVYIDLLITHPLFGRIFGYDGSFRVVRTDKPSAAEFKPHEESTPWCLVGNIVEEHEFGESKEILSGSKYFTPGTKVYCLPPQWGDGYEKVVAVGLARGSRRWITVVLPSRLITNWRAKVVYKSVVLRRLREGFDGFNRQWASQKEVESWAESLRRNRRAG